MAVRRFELVDGKASKFWEISVEGSSHTVRYGRIGTNGQTKTKDFSDEAAAKVSADKLIAQKTKKGYQEVGAPSPPAEAEGEAEPKTGAVVSKPSKRKPSKRKPSKRKPAAKTKAPKLPDLVLPHEKYGARKLENLAAKLARLESENEFNQGRWGILRDVRSDIGPVLAHLLEHEALELVPAIRRYVLGQVHPRRLSNERRLALLATFDEATVRSMSPEIVLAWMCAVDEHAPEELEAMDLLPAFRHALALARAVRDGEPCEGVRGEAITGLLAPLRFGRPATIPMEDKTLALDDEKLAEWLERLSGDGDWVALGDPSLVRMVPWSVLAEALAGRPLEARLALLGGLQDYQILEQCDAEAKAFFEAADALARDGRPGAAPLRLVGMAKAKSPDEIPTGLEDQLHVGGITSALSLDVRALTALGRARRDAWAVANFERRPDALDLLRELWCRGVPFGPDVMKTLIEPGPFASDDGPERWARDISFGHRDLDAMVKRLPVVTRAAYEAGGRVAVALRRWVAALVAAVPEGTEIPLECDALLQPSQIPHVSYFKATAKALQKLPADRAEAVLWRAAPGFAEAPPGTEHSTTAAPYRELRFFRPHLSDRYVERVATILLDHRNDEMMWSDVNHNPLAFKREGMRIGEALAQRLTGQNVPESLLERVRVHLGPEVAERLRTVAERAESVRDEIRRVAAELPSPKTPVYLLWPTEEAPTATSKAYTGGRPRGFGEDDVPRARGRKLVHAFTVELSEVPELAVKYPDARTLSIFLQAYTESVTRAQAHVARTAAAIDAEPGDLDGARAVEIERLEVPTAVFDAERDDATEHLRGLIYRVAGYLLGGPIWLQDGPAAVDPAFIAQLDEHLATGANFGDYGIAYCFERECVWQCH